jgi:hypothetical protein
MGLDQFFYKIKKVSDDKVSKYTGLTKTEIYSAEGSKYIFIPEESINEDKYKELLPYGKKIKIIEEYYDFNKLKKDNDIPESYRMIGIHTSSETDNTIYEFSDSVIDNKSPIKSVEITPEVLNKNYIIFEEETNYILEEEELFYLRKAYIIQSYIHQSLSATVENCGYYKVNNDIIEHINDELLDDYYLGWTRDTNDTIPMIEDEDSEEYGVFYHEWY